MFEALTAWDQTRVLDEFRSMARHAAVLASQERAFGRAGRAADIEDLLRRSEPILSRLRGEVELDPDDRDEVVLLHRILKRELSQADAERVAHGAKTEPS